MKKYPFRLFPYTVGAASVALTMLISPSASAITINFTNAEVDLGSSSQIDLSNQYNSFGLQFTNVYRYIDGRDPFPDFPGTGYGISNGTASQNFDPAIPGRVDFINSPVSSITFDWWSLSSEQFKLFAYDSSGTLQDSFIGAPASSGTSTVTGNISYFTFEDSGGFVSIPNLTFEAVPEPLTLLGAGTALSFGTFFKRKLSKTSKKAN